jgi:hypothetical protein
MNSFVVKSVFAVAFAIAPLAARPLESASVFPAPVSLMDLSPSITIYPNDLALLSTPRDPTNPANSGSLTSVARLSNGAGEKKRVSVIKRADASNFRFDARLPDSPVGLRVPQAGTLYFTPSSAWSFKKEN